MFYNQRLFGAIYFKFLNLSLQNFHFMHVCLSKPPRQDAVGNFKAEQPYLSLEFLLGGWMARIILYGTANVVM